MAGQGRAIHIVSAGEHNSINEVEYRTAYFSYFKTEFPGPDLLRTHLKNSCDSVACKIRGMLFQEHLEYGFHEQLFRAMTSRKGRDHIDPWKSILVREYPQESSDLHIFMENFSFPAKMSQQKCALLGLFIALVIYSNGFLNPDTLLQDAISSSGHSK